MSRCEMKVLASKVKKVLSFYWKQATSLPPPPPKLNPLPPGPVDVCCQKSTNSSYATGMGLYDFNMYHLSTRVHALLLININFLIHNEFYVFLPS